MCFPSIFLNAQSDTDQFITLEKFIENNDVAGDYHELEDQLLRFRQKNNLNKCSSMELMSYKILKSNQVAAILNHKIEFGDFVSILELQTINEISLEEIKLLAQWFTTNEMFMDSKKLWEQITSAKKDVIVSISTNRPTSEAYQTRDSTDFAKYPGSPLSLKCRFRGNYNQKIIYGVNAEKDEGESFLNKKDKRGFDYYSFHLFFNRKTLVKKLAIGDFQAGFGQGLTLGSGMGFGKSAMVLNVKRVNQGLGPYRAFNENGFLRGIGVTIGNNKLENSLIFSRNKIDANVELAQIEGEKKLQIRTLVNDGFHRTELEMSKKDMLVEYLLAHNLNYSIKHLHVGLTNVLGKYDLAFSVSKDIYNRYNFSGNRYFKTGFYLDYYFKNINFFSETTISSNAKPGYVAGVFVSLAKSIDFVLLNRNYSKSFLKLKTNAFSESSEPNNERGTYLGLIYKPNRKVSFSSYFDKYTSPWYSYYVDGMGRGSDFLSEIHFQSSKSSLIYIRFKQKLEIKNTINGHHNSLLWTEKRNFRIHVEFMAASFLKVKSRLEFSDFTNTINQSSLGNLLFLDFIFKKNLAPVSLTLRSTWFNIDNYNSRIYAVENDVMYSWSVPAFSGVGSKYYGILKYKYQKNVSIQIRYAFTHYMDRKVIGTGNNTINSDKLHEINMLISCGF